MSEQSYLDLLQDVMINGVTKSVFGQSDVTIKSVFGRQLRFDLSEGFPIYTTKKVYYRGAFEEMLWFIKGDGDITDLVKRGVHIWDEWAYKHFKKQDISTSLSQDEFISGLTERNEPFYLPIHYTNFTNWGEHNLDQMQWVVDGIRKNPDRKSYYVTCWNPEQAYQMAEQCNQESVVLVACHTDHLVNVSDGKLSLRVNIRSNDLFLGNPFNVAQYAMLTHLYALLTGYEIGSLVVNIDDAHIYSNHFEQIETQLTRTPSKFPSFYIKDRGQKKMQDFLISDFLVEDYHPQSTIKGEVTLVGGY